MNSFFTKCLIVFHAMQKKVPSMLVMLVIVTIIAHLWGNITASRICLIFCICFMVYVLVFSIACMKHRKKCQGFKVYLSFSERRIPGMAQYINDFLKHAFYIFNIDYYDFREHKQFQYLNEPAICEEIDKNLADSDIYLRFISHGLEPNKSHTVNDLWKDVKYNPYTHNLSGKLDYTDYEVNQSFDKFGFNNPNNRFQIVPSEMMISPMEHIHTVYIGPEESALNFTLRLIKELSRGYQEQQYWKRSVLFWKMRDEMMSHLKGR